jgi:GntR family transcriptional repressor for pyruvate dehydrogenase complex
MSLTDDAIESIKQMIIDGRLNPGDRLPKEQELAESLGLSRGSLREAVRALTVMRVLTTRQGDGTYVTSLSPSMLIGATSFIVDFHGGSNLLDFFHVRRVLEAEAAAIAARRLTAEQLDELSALVAEAERLASASPVDHEQMLNNDQRFHAIITEAGGNPVLAAIAESMSGATVRARTWRGLTEDDAAARTVREHGELLEALRQHDPERARLRAAVHVCSVEDWLRRNLQELEAEADGPAPASSDPKHWLSKEADIVVGAGS